jgi:diguanylate cyclase (GGDEF)-like protein/PAS domain S-box-containing protein
MERSATDAYDSVVLDTAPDVAFDDLARLAATAIGAPTALISLVDGRRRWLMGRFNGDDRGPHATTMCGIAIHTPQTVLAVADATVDERFRADPEVVAGRIGSYLGAPLLASDGYPLGTVCVFGPQPRPFSAVQVETLRLIAKTASALLDARRPLAPIPVLQTAVENTKDAIAIAKLEPHGERRFIYVNAAFERMMGYGIEDLRENGEGLLWGPASTALADVHASIARGESVVVEAVNYRHDTTPIDVEVSFTPVRGSGRTPTHWVAIRRDVGERRRIDREIARLQALEESRAEIDWEIAQRVVAEERLVTTSRFDPLTNLMNRPAFLEEFRNRYNGRPTHGAIGAVLVVDLHRFKAVNESLGHNAGDRILVAVARRLEAVLGDRGIIGRIGGDEFAAFLPVIEDAAEAEAIANTVLDALAEAYVLSEGTVTIAATAGIAPCSIPERSASDALGDADLACLHAKRVGHTRYAIFSEQFRIDAAERSELVQALQHAVARGEFFLEYQPVVQTATGCVMGYEALLRWNHPTRGRLAPATFVTLAEEAGSIVEIGAWVLDEACRCAAAWSPTDERPTISVNVSPIELREPGYADRVRATLQRVGLPPNALQLEITETALLDRLDVATDTLRRLRADGIMIAIDDFGTGYSFLTYLRDLPIDVLKIDRSFVSGADGGLANPEIVNAVITLAASLNFGVVAEGVETSLQYEMLATAGCMHMQGYLFGMPAANESTRIGSHAFPVLL